ncbi:MAG: glycine--tRNA ligase subunit beta [Candidatus Westeberhardia cardiocondylae]|nr:glycine--tRNA ligase subunit beta [Candidatus Westeberhardia cardiocondylae]
MQKQNLIMKKYIFLMEIGIEELPPKKLRYIAENFKKFFNLELQNKHFKYRKITWFASPRRIAIKINKLEHNIHVFNKNNEINNFLFKKYKIKKNISLINNNKNVKTFLKKKEQYYIFKTLLFNIVKNILNNAQIFQLMRWGSNTFSFIRPIHTITLLINNKIIPGKILEINIDRKLHGHRFMGKKNIFLNHAKNYPKILFKQGVIVDFQYRKKIIENLVKKEAKNINGIIKLDKSMLEEITSLVEWPETLTGQFQKNFLKLPKEIIIQIIKKIQKCFPIYDKNKKLLSYFIIVVNIKSKNPNKIICGYEQIIHARLQDAEFFFQKDRKLKLIEYLPKLKKITFQTNLGNLYEKTNRIQYLSVWIAKIVNIDIQETKRAAILCKCDLVTDMVTEFPEIQGIIGMHYAKLDNETKKISLAQKEQYQPKFFNDNIPTTLISCAIAISDKIDTLTGMFILNKYPKKNNDPFSLRRIAIGILRIIIEKNLLLNLEKLIKKSINLHNKFCFSCSSDKIYKNILNFILNRYISLYKEKGYDVNVIKSVLSINSNYPANFHAKVQALSKFKQLNKTKQLININTRIVNLLKKTNENTSQNLQEIKFETPEEIQLAKHLIKIKKKIKQLLLVQKYQEILTELTTLQKPIETLFNNVIILTNNKKNRIHRLTLLKNIQLLFLKIADITLLK